MEISAEYIITPLSCWAMMSNMSPIVHGWQLDLSDVTFFLLVKQNKCEALRPLPEALIAHVKDTSVNHF